MMQVVRVKIKSSIVMAKAAFNKKKTLVTSKLDLNLRKKVVKCYIGRGKKNLGTLKNRSEIHYVVLEKHEEDQLGRSCEK